MQEMLLTVKWSKSEGEWRVLLSWQIWESDISQRRQGDNELWPTWTGLVVQINSNEDTDEVVWVTTATTCTLKTGGCDIYRKIGERCDIYRKIGGKIKQSLSTGRHAQLKLLLTTTYLTLSKLQQRQIYYQVNTGTDCSLIPTEFRLARTANRCVQWHMFQCWPLAPPAKFLAMSTLHHVQTNKQMFSTT